MSKVATKTTGIKINKPVKIKVTKTSSIDDFRQRERERRQKEKCKLLDKYPTSEDLFDQLKQEIRTLSNDESSHDLSVGDDYNFGVDYDVDLLLELIRDLREFTQFIKCDDNKHIKEYNLDYLRPYFQD